MKFRNFTPVRPGDKGVKIVLLILTICVIFFLNCTFNLRKIYFLSHAVVRYQIYIKCWYGPSSGSKTFMIYSSQFLVVYRCNFEGYHCFPKFKDPIHSPKIGFKTPSTYGQMSDQVILIHL